MNTYYETNKEKVKEYYKTYCETNKEKFKQYYKTYYYKNKDNPEFAEKKRFLFRRGYYKKRHRWFWDIFQSWKKSTKQLSDNTLDVFRKYKSDLVKRFFFIWKNEMNSILYHYNIKLLKILFDEWKKYKTPRITATFF